MNSPKPNINSYLIFQNQRKYILLFVTILALLINTSYSQFTWQRLYDLQLPGSTVSYCYASCSAENGNFYVGGTVYINNFRRIFVMKINPYGDTIWNRHVDTLGTEIYTMTSTTDGGCVVAGDGIYAIKFDASGGINWLKSYGIGFINLYEIKRTSDGGYIACGFELDAFSNAHHGYLIKLSFDGSLQWQQTYVSTDIKELNSVTQTPDGNYAITGTNSDFLGDTLKMLFIKINSTGTILSEKRYSYFGKINIGLRINQTNSQFVISGNTMDTTGEKTNTCFLRIDSSGNLLSKIKYEVYRNEMFFDMKIINTNKYIFTRNRSLANTLDSYVSITDSNGIEYLSKSFALDEYVIFTSILTMPNGDFIFAGNGRTALPSLRKIFVVRADSNLYAPPIGIYSGNNEIPKVYILKQNYPNPFNPVTKITFLIDKRAFVELTVYSTLGEKVSVLVESDLTAGTYTRSFDGSNLPSGVYFYQINISGKLIESRKMILLK